jgi:hypothetical protein
MSMMARTPRVRPIYVGRYKLRTPEEKKEIQRIRNKKWREKHPEKRIYYGAPFSPKWKKHLEDLFQQKLVGRREDTGGLRRPLSRLQRIYIETLKFGGYSLQQDMYLKTIGYTKYVGDYKQKLSSYKKDYYIKHKEKIIENQKKYLSCKDKKERRSMVVYLSRFKGRWIHVFKTYHISDVIRKMSDEEVKDAYLKMKEYNKTHRGEKIE